MRTLLASTGAAFGLILCASVSAPADAGALATRCGPQGCDHVKCHNDGSFCVRYSDYDSRYNGYIGGGTYVSGGYGGYGGSYGSNYVGNEYAGTGIYGRNGNSYYGSGNYGNGNYGSGYYGNSYGTGYYGGSYGNGYYGGSYGSGTYGGYGSGLHFVCDRDGDRCYSSYAPFWDYREYYRRHGYHWNY